VDTKFCQRWKDIAQIFSSGIRRTNLALRDHSRLMAFFFCLFHFGTSSIPTEILVQLLSFLKRASLAQPNLGKCEFVLFLRWCLQFDINFHRKAPFLLPLGRTCLTPSALGNYDTFSLIGVVLGSPSSRQSMSCSSSSFPWPSVCNSHSGSSLTLKK
jgi:hypothetical protein